jgi:hypothetical protein
MIVSEAVVVVVVVAVINTVGLLVKAKTNNNNPNDTDGSMCQAMALKETVLVVLFTLWNDTMLHASLVTSPTFIELDIDDCWTTIRFVHLARCSYRYLLSVKVHIGKCALEK